jgi:hypothetical protein
LDRNNPVQNVLVLFVGKKLFCILFALITKRNFTIFEITMRQNFSSITSVQIASDCKIGQQNQMCKYALDNCSLAFKKAAM